MPLHNGADLNLTTFYGGIANDFASLPNKCMTLGKLYTSTATNIQLYDKVFTGSGRSLCLISTMDAAGTRDHFNLLDYNYILYNFGYFCIDIEGVTDIIPTEDYGTNLPENFLMSKTVELPNSKCVISYIYGCLPKNIFFFQIIKSERPYKLYMQGNIHSSWAENICTETPLKSQKNINSIHLIRPSDAAIQPLVFTLIPSNHEDYIDFKDMCEGFKQNSGHTGNIDSSGKNNISLLIKTKEFTGPTTLIITSYNDTNEYYNNWLDENLYSIKHFKTTSLPGTPATPIDDPVASIVCPEEIIELENSLPLNLSSINNLTTALNITAYISNTKNPKWNIPALDVTNTFSDGYSRRGVVYASYSQPYFSYFFLKPKRDKTNEIFYPLKGHYSPSYCDANSVCIYLQRIGVEKVNYISGLISNNIFIFGIQSISSDMVLLSHINYQQCFYINYMGEESYKTANSFTVRWEQNTNYFSVGILRQNPEEYPTFASQSDFQFFPISRGDGSSSTHKNLNQEFNLKKGETIAVLFCRHDNTKPSNEFAKWLYTNTKQIQNMLNGITVPIKELNSPETYQNY